MGVRSRSVRFKVLSLLLVPLVSLTALWAFAASITVKDGLALRALILVNDNYVRPGDLMIDELQRERLLSMRYLGSGRTQGREELDAQRPRTDRSVATFNNAIADPELRAVNNDVFIEHVEGITVRTAEVKALRQGVDSGQANLLTTLNGYNQIFDYIYRKANSVALISDPQLADDARALVLVALVKELMAREDAFFTGLSSDHRMDSQERNEFTQLVGARRYTYQRAVNDLPTIDQERHRRYAATDAYRGFEAMEDRISEGTRAYTEGRNGAIPVEPVSVDQWRQAASTVQSGLLAVNTQSIGDAIARSQPVAETIVLRIVLAGGLGLVAVILSILISVRIGRSLVRDLIRLRDSARTLAEKQLPAVVRRLREGEQVDVATEAPPLRFGSGEIEQVGRAFNAAQRTAIQAAVDEAELRRGVNEVFRNLARRSHALLHRQLSLLDTMERRVIDADELGDLFRLDHLATRMRRHAESLIVLSGANSGRSWRRPIPLIDVVRGAVGEVEDYARVAVVPMPRVSLAGPSVGDTIHLLAELIENAALFSPPHTQVQVSGQVVGSGMVLEIEDRGLGMTREQLDDFNEQLENPPASALFDSTRLGFFVVGQLARRHGVRVSLRESAYGGVKAVVHLPRSIVIHNDELSSQEAETGGWAGGNATFRRGGQRPDPEEETVRPLGSPVDLDQPEVPEPRTAPLVSLPSQYDPGGSAPADGAPPESVAVPAVPAEPEPAAAADAVADEPSPAPVHPEPTGPAVLPQRVRQANLTPRLRKRTPTAQHGAEPAEPETVLSRMSAMQHGWRRGRSEAERLLAAEETNGTGQTSQSSPAEFPAGYPQEEERP